MPRFIYGNIGIKIVEIGYNRNRDFARLVSVVNVSDE